MIKKILLVAICLFSSAVVNSQCKFVSKGSLIRMYEKRVPVDIEILVKPKVLFNKYFVAASNTFIETTDGQYFFVIPFSRTYSPKFEVYEDTPIIFYLEDGNELKLNPPENIEGRMLNLTTFNIFLYYKITREQIDKLSSTNILYLRLYVISEKEIENTFEDELGKYFEFEIKSDKYKDNVMDLANCILQNQ
ncbi:MAG: hypothetical protein MUO72_00640 [Bacteroidales bacterium]|nr:hypothetical protein [Bacteroidales bacterium]